MQKCVQYMQIFKTKHLTSNDKVKTVSAKFIWYHLKYIIDVWFF